MPITKFKKYTSTALISLLFLLMLILPATAAPASPEIKAAAAVLYAPRVDRLLWQKNGKQRRPIASTTKIMTSLLVLEKLGLSDNITISQKAAGLNGNKINYRAGDIRSVDELLYAMMLFSSNQAAEALAERIAVDDEGFARLMNAKAAQLGAKDTLFRNPHGLPSPQPHYSTAEDLALMTTAAWKLPYFRKLASTRAHVFKGADGRDRRIENINELLKTYPGAAGVKTGYTVKSGYCLVAAAKRGGLLLIAVVLGEGKREDSFKDAATLLNFGFNNYVFRQVISKEKLYAVRHVAGGLGNVRIKADKNIEALVFNQPGTIDYKPRIFTLKAPVHRGQVLGDIAVSQYGVSLGRARLLADNSITVKPKKNKHRRRGWLALIDMLLSLLHL